VLQQRAAAAEQIRALMGRPKPARDDIGADSGGEIKRLREHNEELKNENAYLRRENLALRTEIDQLKARLAAVPPPDDGFDIPEFLRRSAS
jgi:FtsZ-binding cell division protein ZapB